MDLFFRGCDTPDYKFIYVHHCSFNMLKIDKWTICHLTQVEKKSSSEFGLGQSGRFPVPIDTSGFRAHQRVS